MLESWLRNSKKGRLWWFDIFREQYHDNNTQISVVERDKKGTKWGTNEKDEDEEDWGG
jgi:hypothetical protein